MLKNRPKKGQKRPFRLAILESGPTIFQEIVQIAAKSAATGLKMVVNEGIGNAGVCKWLDGHIRHSDGI